jgi:hypothetical protein
MVGDRYYGALTPAKARAVLKSYRDGTPPSAEG